MNQDMQIISFQGSQILTIEQDGIHYAAMKPVCESIGLNWRAQYNRIKRNPVLNSTVVIMTTVAEDGVAREMLMLPLKSLHGWLVGVDVNRVKPEIKDKLIAYQEECFDVLHDYWQKKMIQPKIKDVSTAACFSELHVFLEVTRGRMRTSNKGNPHNTVSMTTALVLQYLYNLPDEDDVMRVSCRETGKKLKIDNRTASRAIDRMSKWSFLTKESISGQKLWVRLNRRVINDALILSKNSLLTNQQRVGFLPAA